MLTMLIQGFVPAGFSRQTSVSILAPALSFGCVQMPVVTLRHALGHPSVCHSSYDTYSLDLFISEGLARQPERRDGRTGEFRHSSSSWLQAQGSKTAWPRRGSRSNLPGLTAGRLWVIMNIDARTGRVCGKNSGGQATFFDSRKAVSAEWNPDSRLLALESDFYSFHA